MGPDWIGIWLELGVLELLDEGLASGYSHRVAREDASARLITELDMLLVVPGQ